MSVGVEEVRRGEKGLEIPGGCKPIAGDWGDQTGGDAGGCSWGGLVDQGDAAVATDRLPGHAAAGDPAAEDDKIERLVGSWGKGIDGLIGHADRLASSQGMRKWLCTLGMKRPRMKRLCSMERRGLDIRVFGSQN